MAAPTNVSIETATVIGSLPYDYTQTNINDGGVNYTVYYKFTAPTGAKVIGAWGFSGNIGSGYRPTVNVYNSVGEVHRTYGYQNVPIQIPVIAGDSYYLEFVRNTDSAGPESLRVRVEVAPALEMPAGSLIISDDNEGYPIAILSGTTGEVINFVSELYAMERGTQLIEGDKEILFTADFSDGLRLYDSGLNLITAIDEHYDHVSSNKVDTFYVGNPGTYPGKAYVTTINKAGVLGPKTWTFPELGLITLAPNNAETILYFSGQVSSNDTKISRWDLINDVALSDLVPNLGNNYKLLDEILVLADDSIIVGYERGTPTVSTIIKRFSSAGVLLNTYDLGNIAQFDGRLAYALDHPNSFWVWLKIANAVSRFINIKVSDGSTLETFDSTQYGGGGYNGPESATPTARFGAAESCPLLIAFAEIPTEPPPPPVLTPYSGIYYIHPDKASKHDSYYGDLEKKIPNPTWRTAYLGE